MVGRLYVVAHWIFFSPPSPEAAGFLLLLYVLKYYSGDNSFNYFTFAKTDGNHG